MQNKIVGIWGVSAVLLGALVLLRESGKKGSMDQSPDPAGSCWEPSSLVLLVLKHDFPGSSEERCVGMAADSGASAITGCISWAT